MKHMQYANYRLIEYASYVGMTIKINSKVKNSSMSRVSL